MSSRNAIAATQLATRSATAAATGRTTQVANDVTHSAEKAQSERWVLTPEARARLRGVGIALPDSAIARVPAYAEERFQWMEGIAATAWGSVKYFVSGPRRFLRSA